MSSRSLDVSAEPITWKATVIDRYDFEPAKVGDSCLVVAQTAFAAWRKAEPLLAVAKEHLALERVEEGPRPAAARPAKAKRAKAKATKRR